MKHRFHIPKQSRSTACGQSKNSETKDQPRILTDDSPMISHSVFQTAESVHPCRDSLMIQIPTPTDSHSIWAQNPWIHDHIPAGF